MNVEYVQNKISCIRWLHGDTLNRSIDSTEQFWISGSYESTRNSISIWSNVDNVSDNQPVPGIYPLKNLLYNVDSDVISIVPYEKRTAIVSLLNGDILWLKYSLDSGFQLIHKWENKKDLLGHESSALLVNDANELVSSGLDGKLYFLDIQTKKITKTPKLTSSSLHCLDKISPNETVCGTTSGHIKLFDKRTQKVELSLANELSIITTVARNSHIPHIIACANDLGLLYIWDLRNGGQRPIQPASAHSAAINCLQYVDNQPNLLFTSSFDGQLIKWNISNDFEINSVEAIIDKNNTYPINCFDINQNNQIVFSDDNEVMYLTTF